MRPAFGEHGSKLHGKSSYPSSAVLLVRDLKGSVNVSSEFLDLSFTTSASVACLTLLPRSPWTRPKRAATYSQYVVQTDKTLSESVVTYRTSCP